VHVLTSINRASDIQIGRDHDQRKKKMKKSQRLVKRPLPFFKHEINSTNQPKDNGESESDVDARHDDIGVVNVDVNN
jgi:hypothetical protein